MWTQPCPFVKKNWSLVLFHAISLTSKLNCSSARILCVRVSMNVTKSSLLPTAIVFPSGDQVMLMFSPFVLIIVGCFPDLMSQIRTVLSPLAVLNRSGWVACQHNWSTDPVWPRNVVSFAYLWHFRHFSIDKIDIRNVSTLINYKIVLPNGRDRGKILLRICQMIRMLDDGHRSSILQNEPEINIIFSKCRW